MTDRLFLKAQADAGIAPSEVPLHLKAGDQFVLTAIMGLPPAREFPAVIPVTLATHNGELWKGPILVCPWDARVLCPAGAPRVRRHERRIGYCADGLIIRTLTAYATPKALSLDIFSEGWKNAELILSVQGAPPRSPITATQALPARRAWHTLTYDLGGYSLVRHSTITLKVVSRGTVLLGGIRVVE